jgi:hypothetical protein
MDVPINNIKKKYGDSKCFYIFSFASFISSITLSIFVLTTQIKAPTDTLPIPITNSPTGLPSPSPTAEPSVFYLRPSEMPTGSPTIYPTTGEPLEFD